MNSNNSMIVCCTRSTGSTKKSIDKFGHAGKQSTVVQISLNDLMILRYTRVCREIEGEPHRIRPGLVPSVIHHDHFNKFLSSVQL